MSDKLAEIIAHKREEIAPLLPLADKLKAGALARNDFFSLEAALRSDPSRLGLIAEVKKASPSAGSINAQADPVQYAIDYAAAGANAISVLTDEKYFSGRLEYLSQIRQAVDIPLLRKDFIVDAVQIHEAVVAGADAILLIIAALETDEYLELLNTAHSAQLEVLVEVHNLAELEIALNSEARLIGVNNRNLKSFEVDLETTASLADEIPEDLLLVAESGIREAEDAQFCARAGADALLVGEALMRSNSLSTSIELLRQPIPEDRQERRGLSLDD